MRTLNRNKKPFYHAPFAEKRPYTHEDEYGNIIPTTEWETIYGPPVLFMGNISPAKGEAQARHFGVELDYDKVIALDDPQTPIDEFSVLWIDTLPTLDERGETQTPHDYIVKKVARSLNSVSIAVSKVSVSAPFRVSTAFRIFDYDGNALFDSAGVALYARG